MSAVPENIEREVLIANIHVGLLYEGAPIGFATDDGTEIDPDNIEARLEFRTRPGGGLITSMATAGGGDADGEIAVEVRSATEIALVASLGSDVTETLVPVYDSETNSVSMAGIGQLVVWSPDIASGAHMPGAWYHLRIWPEVTG